MLTEDEVLYELKLVLQEKEWHILSYKSPGGHGGTIIVKNSQCSIVPDMIALKNQYILCAEAKSEYSYSDEKKLSSLFLNKKMYQDLKESCLRLLKARKLAFRKDLEFIKALAYSKGTKFPDDFVVFRIPEQRKVEIIIGKEVSGIPLP
jgi:hypothetical protein